MPVEDARNLLQNMKLVVRSTLPADTLVPSLRLAFHDVDAAVPFIQPETMQEVSRVTPHAWALDAYLQLLASPDPNVALVLQACGALVLFGMGFLVLAWRFMRLD